VEIEGQLDATDSFILQNLLFVQQVSGTIMPIIRSSKFIQMVAAYGTWRFGLQVVGLMWNCGLCVRFAGCCSIPQTGHITHSPTNFGHHHAHHQELKIYTDGCCLWYLALWFTGRWSDVELWVMCPVCAMLQHPANRTHNPQLHTRPATCKPQHEIPQVATTV